MSGKLSLYTAHPAGTLDPLSFIDLSMYVSPAVWASRRVPWSQILGQVVN